MIQLLDGFNERLTRLELYIHGKPQDDTARPFIWPNDPTENGERILYYQLVNGLIADLDWPEPRRDEADYAVKMLVSTLLTNVAETAINPPRSSWIIEVRDRMLHG